MGGEPSATATPLPGEPAGVVWSSAVDRGAGRRWVRSVAIMYDERKVDEAVLALLHLNAFKDRYGWRAWKGLDWGALDRLHERGLIGDPKSKASRSR